MSGLYGTLELGQRAVQTQRQGIELTGHNIANVDNPAYARQRLDVTTGPATIGADGFRSAGVTSDRVRQIRNQLLDTNIQEERSLTSFLEAKRDLLASSRAELGPTLLADLAGSGTETVSGLAKEMNALFLKFQDLANDPASPTHRKELLNQARNLANTFNDADQRLNQINQQIDQDLAAQAAEANSLLGEIANLNQSIETAENRSASPANDLRDRRTDKLEKLSQLTALQTAESANGVMTVLLNGEVMVEGGNALGAFEIAPNAAGNLTAALVTENGQFAVTLGRLAGPTEARDEVLVPLQQQLNDLANQLIDEVNQVHQNGFDLEGNTGQDFFQGNGAATIEVNSDLIENPGRIQAAAEANAPGDNRVLQELSRLSEVNHPALANLTFSERLTTVVGDFATAINEAETRLEDQVAIQDLLLRERNAVSGVSIDEEMTHLVKYQNAFEASARLVSVIDEMLQTVVNLGR